MTAKEVEFRSSQALRESLSQVLRDPTLQMALEIIRMAPDEFPSQIAGVHQDLLYSREFAKTVGTNNAIKRLTDLSKPLSTSEPIQEDSLRPEWMDNIPQEMKDALVKIQNQ